MKSQKSKVKSQKVIVAMSGGVDSSVAAALLKGADFDVKGVFLKLYDSPRFRKGEKRAKKVAKILKIPIKVLDLRKEFKRIVIDYFLEEYKRGRTPNPCVVCNKEIKFGLLLEKALALDVDYITTGHYARISSLEKHNNFPHRGKFCSILGLAPRLRRDHGRSSSEKFSLEDILAFKLLRAKDKDKDQSYFLWQLNQKQLGQILFPLGGYTKKEVKKMAKKFKLPVFEAPESQEVCFEFSFQQKPGRIADIQGKNLGSHQGLAFYTIGQRKGIGLSGGPYWVLDKNMKKNLLLVTKNEKDLYKKELIFKNANWISGRAPKFPLEVKAKIRYRHKAQSVTLISSNKLIFSRAQKAITPGQSVVFYRGRELLGGGIIR